MARRASRKDVALLAGVSVAVVSYVMNGGPRPVAAGTRERVMAAVNELNYRPNALAKALKLDRTNVIALLVPDISNPFFAEFSKHLQSEAFALGYSLIVGDTSLDPAKEAAQVESLLDREIDGIVLFGMRNLSLLSSLRPSGIRVVSLDHEVSTLGFSTVVVNDYQAARDAVDHLIAHGHKRVGFIGGPTTTTVAQDRRRGWEDSIAEHGLTTNPEPRAFSAEYTREGGYQVTKRILDSPQRPTALFVSSDVQAVGVLRACRESGTRVPEDLAIFSFDGTKESEFSWPRLSTVVLPLKEMAVKSLKALTASGSDAVSEPVEHALALRASCGC